MSARVLYYSGFAKDRHSLPLSKKKQKDLSLSLSLSLYLFVYTYASVYMRERVYMCVRFRRICNILFCIENDLGAILRVPLEPYAPSFPWVPWVRATESPPGISSRFLPRVLREVLAGCHGRRRPVSLFSRSLFFE